MYSNVSIFRTLRQVPYLPTHSTRSFLFMDKILKRYDKLEKCIEFIANIEWILTEFDLACDGVYSFVCDHGGW